MRGGAAFSSYYTAMLGNEVDVIFDAFLGLQQFKSGRFRALAVTSATRSSVLPDVPTLLEAGLKGVVVESARVQMPVLAHPRVQRLL